MYTIYNGWEICLEMNEYKSNQMLQIKCNAADQHACTTQLHQEKVSSSSLCFLYLTDELSLPEAFVDTLLLPDTHLYSPQVTTTTHIPNRSPPKNSPKAIPVTTASVNFKRFVMLMSSQVEFELLVAALMHISMVMLRPSPKWRRRGEIRIPSDTNTWKGSVLSDVVLFMMYIKAQSAVTGASPPIWACSERLVKWRDRVMLVLFVSMTWEEERERIVDPLITVWVWGLLTGLGY